MGQLQGLIPNIGATSAQTNAINQLTSLGQAGNPYASGTQSAIDNMLRGGGAQTYAPQVQQANQTYQGQVQPLASNTNYDPMQTPGIGDQLQALRDSITTGVNGQFAAAGRDMSGYNQKALASGLASGLAPVLTQQYNQNVLNQQNAANAGYNANNTATGMLAGMQQQGVANQNTGLGNVAPALANSTWGPQTAFTAQQLGQSTPASNLGLLAQIGIPLAALGTQSSGTQNTTSTPSMLSTIGSLGGLFSAPAGGTSAAAGLGQAASGIGSGILGLLGAL